MMGERFGTALCRRQNGHIFEMLFVGTDHLQRKDDICIQNVRQIMWTEGSSGSPAVCWSIFWFLLPDLHSDTSGLIDIDKVSRARWQDYLMKGCLR